MSLQPPRRQALLAMRGRAELGLLQIHGEALYLHALRALADAHRGPLLVSVDAGDAARVRDDVRRLGADALVVSGDEWWQVVRGEPGQGLMIHDVLCPLTPASFLRAVLDRSDSAPESSLAGYRPVTDTLKVVVDDRIEGTLDRDTVVAVTSPILVSGRLLSGPGAQMPLVDDFAALVGQLRSSGVLELVKAPSLGRRVDDRGAVHLLESVDEVGRRLRSEPGHPSRSTPED